MIAFENVSKSFGDKRVLDAMTLDMADTGITCLLGASGCGKSTALRVAAGLIPPDAGSGPVFIPAGACGVVFQDTRLLPWLADVALDAAEAGGLFPRELSGGMAQRAGIARALLRRPRFLMMDEPFASLDAMTRGDLQIMLKELVDEQGMACLFVTHDMDEAFVVARRVVVMRGGRAAATFEAEEFSGWERRERVRDHILTCLGRKQGA